jgi:hypothetical protein
MLVSPSLDREIVVIVSEEVKPNRISAPVHERGSEIIGRARITNAQLLTPLNDRVFSALQGTGANGHVRWREVTAKGKEGATESLFLPAQKSGLPAEFLADARQVITPGITIIFTDRPVDPTTQSHRNFQIVVAQKDKPSGTAD